MPAFSLHSFPQAIIHIDGDCFFASCEIAKNPKLKGKPVATGLERGIISSLTYEAKALGLSRAMSLREAKKICPSLILLPSDYETYSLYSQRMYNIVRRYTSTVEEYSIDECFADISGLRRPLHNSYQGIAAKIKANLDQELGMTFSIGLAPTKVLAKVASKWQKPSGLTCIPAREAHLFLAELPVAKVWGIGPQTTAYLQNFGIKTALDFATRPREWVIAKLTKPHQEIWQELRGEKVYQLNTLPHDSYQSISKTKTFTPPSSEQSYVFAQLAKNVENAFIKARRHHLASRHFFFFLKTQDFKFSGWEIKLNQNTSNPVALMPLLREYFGQVFKSNTLYRATGVVLMGLSEDQIQQLDLFTSPLAAERVERVFGSFDVLAAKYGKHVLFLGASWAAMVKSKHHNYRNVATQRKSELLKGENSRQRLGLPILGTLN